MIMNREVKFRGKSTTNKEWKYGIPIALDDSTIIVEDEGVFNNGSASPFFSKWDFVISETIGQFTGLHDKNRKEIYEGDILRSVKFHDIVGYIMYDKEEGAFMFIKIDELMKTELETRCHITERWLNEFPKEVIGNIYDNKELLEE